MAGPTEQYKGNLVQKAIRIVACPWVPPTLHALKYGEMLEMSREFGTMDLNNAALIIISTSNK